MRQAGEYRIAASRAEVWAALGDLERLKGCLAGCQSLEQTGEGEFMVSLDPAAHETALAPKGQQLTEPVIAEARLTELDPPSSCLLNVGAGSAVVKLEDAGEFTRLSYQAGGELADAAAARLADDFFAKFTAGFDRNTSDYQPSQQWMIWAIMFGVLLLAVVLTL